MYVDENQLLYMSKLKFKNKQATYLDTQSQQLIKNNNYNRHYKFLVDSNLIQTANNHQC